MSHSFSGGADISVRRLTDSVFLRVSCIGGKAPSLQFFRNSLDATTGRGATITRWRLQALREAMRAIERLELDELSGMPPRSVADLMDDDDADSIGGDA